MRGLFIRSEERQGADHLPVDIFRVRSKPKATMHKTAVPMMIPVSIKILAELRNGRETSSQAGSGFGNRIHAPRSLILNCGTTTHNPWRGVGFRAVD
jgi:hypothetical protein